ncbi:MAG: cation transporter [Acidobacteria bacterium]|nr:cation transporter [Acidobacteriota bacterium]
MHTIIDRPAEVRRGLRLEYITLSYNLVEALVSLVAGAMAGRIALIGFGVDAVIESISGSIMLWRLHLDGGEHRERIEKRALRLIGASFLILATYVAYESAMKLITREAPDRSIPGIVIACLSLIVMPVLARKKRAVGRNLHSAAMVADSRQTQLCSYLSAILLGGLLLNAAAGWWWADPVAGLIMTPIIAREGIAGLRGEGCSCGHH